MTVENISWSISTKECCRPRRGLNPRPPDLQSDGASNWATEAILLMVRVCKSSIIFLCVYPSVRPSSVNLSATLSPSKALGALKLSTSLPLIVRVCESNIFFVRPSFVHLSVKLSPKPLSGIQPNLLPLWLGCARATLFFRVSIRRPSICLSHYLLLNHWVEFNQTCYITSPHGKGVR